MLLAQRLCVNDTVGLPEKQLVAEKETEGERLKLIVPLTVAEGVKDFENVSRPLLVSDIELQ